MTISWRYAARSDIGLVRQSNQDSGYAGPHLCVLCDGMGGPAGGDLASAVAVDHLAPLDDDIHKAEELIPLLREAVQDAHADMVEHSTQNPELAGLGTTCIAVMRSGNKLAMVHVGDSRAYLLRDGELTQVTTDHTFVEYLVETGRLTPEQARRHPQRSVLLRVLGDGDGEVQLDESIREALPGDRWILCSDGLSGPVTDETITEILATVPEPADAGQQLIDLALKAGGPDNVTAVIFDIVEDDLEPQLVPQVVGSAAADQSLRKHSSPGGQAKPAPTSPAAKAAALLDMAEPVEEPEQEVEETAEQETAPRGIRRIVGRVVGFLTVIGLLALGLVLGWNWTQNQYYVSAEDGHVVVYQGIPQTLGPVILSHAVHTYDEPLVSELDAQMVARLEETVAQPSLEAAQNYVEETVMSRVVEQEEEEQDEDADSTETTDDEATPKATAEASATAED